MKFSEYLIEDLKKEALDAYQELSRIPEKFQLKQKKILELEELSDYKPWLNIFSDIDDAITASNLCGGFYHPVKELVEKGVLDFDTDDKLEDIVKLL